jgi:hypothetical protein
MDSFIGKGQQIKNMFLLLSVDVSNISLKIWHEKLIWPNSIWKTLMDLEVGCVVDLSMDAILTFYWTIVFVSHFKIDFMLHIGEESCVKIQDLVIDFKFDIHVHRIDGCYNLKVNYFHHKKVSFVITHCKENLHYCE